MRRQRRSSAPGLVAILVIAALLPSLIWAAPKSKPKADTPELWEMSLDGGRKLSWEHSFHSETEVKPNRGFQLFHSVGGAMKRSQGFSRRDVRIHEAGA